MKGKIIKITSIFFVFVAVVLVWRYVDFSQTPNKECLNDIKDVKVEISDVGDTYETNIIFTINQRGDERFLIDSVFRNSFLVQARLCNVYATRQFGYNPRLGKQEHGFRGELWRYDYNGAGEKILTLYEVNENNKFAGYFSALYSVDPFEKYLVLEKTYTNPDDNWLVFRNLNNLDKNVFELPYQEVFKNHPYLQGSFDFLSWSDDGRYFWGRFFIAAYSYGFISIDTDTWQYDAFEAPQHTMGGDRLNPNNGWVTYRPNPYWSGDAEATEAEREGRKQQGLSSDLHIYNLFTKEDRLIESTKEDPIWHYKPNWISKDELKYQLPSGEWKIYNLKTGEYTLVEA